MWAKIEDFQKKGAAQNFKQAMEANSVVIKLNNDMIKSMEQVIADEEQEDTQLRQQYGATFQRLPSGTVNGQYKQSISDYKNKL